MNPPNLSTSFKREPGQNEEPQNSLLADIRSFSQLQESIQSKFANKLVTIEEEKRDFQVKMANMETENRELKNTCQRYSETILRNIEEKDNLRKKLDKVQMDYEALKKEFQQFVEQTHEFNMKKHLQLDKQIHVLQIVHNELKDNAIPSICDARNEFEEFQQFVKNKLNITQNSTVLKDTERPCYTAEKPYQNIDFAIPSTSYSSTNVSSSYVSTSTDKPQPVSTSSFSSFASIKSDPDNQETESSRFDAGSAMESKFEPDMLYFNKKKIPKMKLDMLWDKYKYMPKRRARWFADILELVFGRNKLKKCSFCKEPVKGLDSTAWNAVKLYAIEKCNFKEDEWNKILKNLDGIKRRVWLKKGNFSGKGEPKKKQSFSAKFADNIFKTMNL